MNQDAEVIIIIIIIRFLKLVYYCCYFNSDDFNFTVENSLYVLY